MNYTELKQQVRRGDAEAAKELLAEARAIKDGATVLACWSVLAPGRFRAWNALMAALRSARWLPAPQESDSPLGEVAARTGATNQIRADIIARTLVAACQQVIDVGDQVGERLLQLAEAAMEPGHDELDERARKVLDDSLAAALLTDDDDTLMAMLDAASKILVLKLG